MYCCGWRLVQRGQYTYAVKLCGQQGGRVSGIQNHGADDVADACTHHYELTFWLDRGRVSGVLDGRVASRFVVAVSGRIGRKHGLVVRVLQTNGQVVFIYCEKMFYVKIYVCVVICLIMC